mmetsp:Transcript_7380/g.11669  ORF Transcript_7380/g.11669 Transcript_7380/m.11669 type:complete len:454 (-) Transcript_7380:139-1500(-)
MMRPDSPVEQLQHRSSSVVPLSDLERDNLALQEQHDMAAQLLDTIGHVLDGADDTLENLENDSNLLPSAILRKCSEFADIVGGLASELEHQSPQEQQRLARAIQDDVNSLALMEECPPGTICVPSLADGESKSNVQASPSNGDVIQENDILQALAGAATLLRDVESAFRDVGKDDAEEIADVGLTLARLFLISLQNVHSTLTPENLLTATSSSFAGDDEINDRSSPRSTVVIEDLSDPVEMDNYNEDEAYSNRDPNTPSKINQQRHRTKSTPRRSSKRKVHRVRVLWPPIGPHVEAAAGWTKDEATKRPLLAVALGLTLWPVAISTALLGGTVCMVDGVLQDIYNHFHEKPLIQGLEQGAAQAYQAGRLTLVTGRLVGKQTLRVVKKQIDRNGGLGPILEKLGHLTVDRVTHPAETAGMVWNSLNWGIDRIKDTVEQVISFQQEGTAAQELQQ